MTPNPCDGCPLVEADGKCYQWDVCPEYQEYVKVRIEEIEEDGRDT